MFAGDRQLIDFLNMLSVFTLNGNICYISFRLNIKMIMFIIYHRNLHFYLIKKVVEVRRYDNGTWPSCPNFLRVYVRPSWVGSISSSNRNTSSTQTNI